MLRATTDLDLGSKEIKNMKFEELASDPTSGNFENRFYTNTTTGATKRFKGGEWVDAISDIRVKFVATTNDLPATGLENVMYVIKDLNGKYIWNTTSLSYIELSRSEELTLPNRGTNVPWFGAGLYNITDEKVIDLGAGVKGEVRKLTITPQLVATTWSAFGTGGDVHGSAVITVPAYSHIGVPCDDPYTGNNNMFRISTDSFSDDLRAYLYDTVNEEVIMQGTQPTASNNYFTSFLDILGSDLPAWSDIEVRFYNYSDTDIDLPADLTNPTELYTEFTHTNDDWKRTNIRPSTGGKLNGVVDGEMRVQEHNTSVMIMSLGGNDWVSNKPLHTPFGSDYNDRMPRRIARELSYKIDEPLNGKLARGDLKDVHVSEAFTTATTLTVTHNFGRYAFVTVSDSTGLVITPDTVTHDNTNEVTITFTVGTTGTITCK